MQAGVFEQKVGGLDAYFLIDGNNFEDVWFDSELLNA